MAEDKREVEREGGEYMIQDRDHTSEVGQMGGKASHGRGRQSEQSQGGSQQHGGGQQGGERSRKRNKLL